MGKAEQRNKSQAFAEYMKSHGITRKTGQCPWGCGGTYKVSPSGGNVNGGGLMEHLNRCQGGGAKKRNRLTNVVSSMGRRTRR